MQARQLFGTARVFRHCGAVFIAIYLFSYAA